MMKTEQFERILNEDNMTDISDFNEFYKKYLKSDELKINEEWNALLIKKSGKTAKEIRFALLDNYHYAEKLRIDSDDQYLPKNIYSISVKKVDYIIAKAPSKRIDVILLGIICGLTRDEINRSLQRYLKQSKLYPRDIEDFIWIYLIEHKNLYETKQFLSVFYKTKAVLNRNLSSAELVDKSVQAANTVEMNSFLRTSKAYIEYIDNPNVIKSFIETRTSMIEQFDKMFDSQIGIRKNIHTFDCHENGSRAYKSLNNAKNEIKKERIPAKRCQIIALCLHLNQDKDGINRFLDSCGMERLLSKNLVEAFIIFVSNFIHSIGDYYSNGVIDENDAEHIKASWMWDYIVESSDEEYIDKNISDFNLPVSVINGFIQKEFLENKDIDKESDLYKYMVSLHGLL